MKNMKRWLLAPILVCCMNTIPASAQGGQNIPPGDDSHIESIAQRVLKIQKKSDAFNLFLNLHCSYQQRFDGDDKGGAFKGRQIRLEMKGDLGIHWSYWFRYRLNRSGERQDDNFTNNIDYIQVDYRFNDRWRLTAGKKQLNLGGFEFDYNPIQIHEYSEFVGALEEFHLAVQVAHTIAKGHKLQLEVFNTNNNSIDKVYPGAGLERSQLPLGLNLNWTGNLLRGKLQTLWAYSFMNEAKGANTHLLMLGQKLNMKKWQVSVDYNGAWEDADRHGIITAETGAVARNVTYHSVVGEANWQPAAHWNLFAKGALEKASVRGDEHLRNYRTSYSYQAGIQWYPDLTQDAKLSLAYVGKGVRYKEGCGLQDYNSNRIELSLIYRMKLY